MFWGRCEKWVPSSVLGTRTLEKAGVGMGRNGGEDEWCTRQQGPQEPGPEI